MSKKKRKTIHKDVGGYDYVIYTDGGCAVNPGGRGGYGVVVVNKHTGEVTTSSAGFKSTTNNRMEITAAIVGMQQVKEGESALLISDSQYFIKCFSGEWERKKNKDLFAKADAAARGKTIVLDWVKGHAGNEYNELCDSMATEAMSGADLQDDVGYVAEKAAGRAFYERLDAHETRRKGGGALAVDIQVPQELASEIDLMSKREYAEKHNVHSACASAIIDFAMFGSRSFKSYAALKTGGVDAWSRKGLDALIEAVQNGAKVYECIKEYLPSEKEAISALRWCARGLPVKDSIRKILVDKEISENCIRG